MTKQRQKTKKLNTDQKIDQVLEIVKGLAEKQDGFTQRLDGFSKKQDGFTQRLDGFSKKQDGFTQRLDGLAENQELMLKTINEFSTRIEEKIDNIDIKVDQVEDSLKKEMKGMENRMVNKDYLDRKFAAAGIKTSAIPV